MFTGIITDVGTVESAEQRGDLRLRISCGYDLDTIALGASIACSGVCLTVVDKGEDWFAVDVSAETQSRTAAGLWKPGAKLNLERSLKVGDELGGHIVTGHVDAVVQTIEARPEGDSTRLTIRAPHTIARYLAPKGSVALDGVSLTVNELAEDEGVSIDFTVNIIPHTASHTTFDKVAEGRQLNVEIDVLARYIDRMIGGREH